MKKLFFLIILIPLFSSCQKLNTTDGLAHAVYNSLKNNDFAAYQSLYLTSQEVETLTSNGVLKVPDSLRQSAIDYYKPEAVLDHQTSRFRELRNSDKIAWSQSTFESSDFTSVKDQGIDVYKITIYFLINGKVESSNPIKALKISEGPYSSVKDKFVLIR